MQVVLFIIALALLPTAIGVFSGLVALLWAGRWVVCFLGSASVVLFGLLYLISSTGQAATLGYEICAWGLAGAVLCAWRLIRQLEGPKPNAEVARRKTLGY